MLVDIYFSRSGEELWMALAMPGMLPGEGDFYAPLTLIDTVAEGFSMLEGKHEVGLVGIIPPDRIGLEY